MSTNRYATACSLEELQKRVNERYKKECSHDDSQWNGFSGYELQAIFEKDLKKVEFDCENFEYESKSPVLVDSKNPQNLIGWHTLDNGFSFLGCYGGGDWEYPVFFILYWSGKEVRAYIPDKGNVYNHQIKQAYGNNEESDTEALGGELDDVRPDFNYVELIENIKSRIKLLDTESNVNHVKDVVVDLGIATNLVDRYHSSLKDQLETIRSNPSIIFENVLLGTVVAVQKNEVTIEFIIKRSKETMVLDITRFKEIPLIGDEIISYTFFIPVNAKLT